MKLYLAIKPMDRFVADVDMFYDKESAERILVLWEEANPDCNPYIKELDVDTRTTAVYGTSTDRRYLLGYVYNSHAKDIAAYFDERKGYGLEYEEVRPIEIPNDFYCTKKKLLKEKAELENKLKILEQKLTLHDA